MADRHPLGGLSTAAFHSVSERFKLGRKTFGEGSGGSGTYYGEIFDVSQAPEVVFTWGLRNNEMVVLESVIDVNGTVNQTEDMIWADQKMCLDSKNNWMVISLPGRYRLRLENADPSQIQVRRYPSIIPYQDYYNGLTSHLIAKGLIPRIEALEALAHDEIHYTLSENGTTLILTAFDGNGNPTGEIHEVDLSRYLSDDYVNDDPTLDTNTKIVSIPMQSGNVWRLDLSPFLLASDLPEDVKLSSVVDNNGTLQFTLSDGTTLSSSVDLSKYNEYVTQNGTVFTFHDAEGGTVSWDVQGDTQIIIERIEEELIYVRVATQTDSGPLPGDGSTRYLVLQAEVPVSGVYIVRARTRVDSFTHITGAWLQVHVSDTNGFVNGGATDITTIPNNTAMPWIMGGRDQAAIIAPRDASGGQLYYPQLYVQTENYTLRLQQGQVIHYSIRVDCRNNETFTINNPELILARTLSALQ